MSRLVLALALLGILTSVPMNVFNGFHLLCLIVIGFALWAVEIGNSKLHPPVYSDWDARDGLPRVPGDRRA